MSLLVHSNHAITMPNHWLLKTEPTAYSYDDLAREGHATWDGVANPVALKNLRGMSVGDEVFVYHTGNEKQVVGVGKVLKAAYPDPKADDPKLVVIELAPVRKLARSVTLASIKADPRFVGWDLVRLPRLSVMPVSTAQWTAILALGR